MSARRENFMANIISGITRTRGKILIIFFGTTYVKHNPMTLLYVLGPSSTEEKYDVPPSE
jgi:hypothetical protein